MVLIKVVKGDEGFNRLMRKCIESGGVPVVITRYAGKPIRYGGRPAVVFRCYGLWDSRGVTLDYSFLYRSVSFYTSQRYEIS